MTTKSCTKIPWRAKMEYHLQYSPKEERYLIDSIPHPGFEIRESIEADSWLEAKLAFGFELTPLQKTMLGK